MREYQIGQEVDVLTKHPDIYGQAGYERAFIVRNAAPGRIEAFVQMRESGDERYALLHHIRPADLSLGDLEGTFKIVDGCNGLYVYHLPTDECTGAGDGSETTLADLAEYARFDPVSFAEEFGPGDTWRLCGVCGEWKDVYIGEFHCVSVGNPPKGEWVCKECYAEKLVIVTPPDTPARIFGSVEDAAKYTTSPAIPYPTGDFWENVRLEEAVFL